MTHSRLSVRPTPALHNQQIRPLIRHGLGGHTALPHMSGFEHWGVAHRDMAGARGAACAPTRACAAEPFILYSVPHDPAVDGRPVGCCATLLHHFSRLAGAQRAGRQRTQVRIQSFPTRTLFKLTMFSPLSGAPRHGKRSYSKWLANENFRQILQAQPYTPLCADPQITSWGEC
jgi:hypothetical protein